MSGALQVVFQNQRSFTSPPVNTVAPVVSGTATVGQTLTTTNGTWTGLPAPTFTYQWQRVTTNISGATSSTYVLVAADAGNTVRCVVTATNVVSAVSANSNSTASVAATVPGAPTIGTATATGSTTATVAYTAPASNGGATITSYTATSSPSGVTGTLSQAGSGTITVSGLSAGTAYTFTVKATNSVGQSAASAASNSITTVPALGSAYGGGYFIGQISTSGNGVATHNLVIAPKASGNVYNKKYKTVNTAAAGSDSLFDGAQNTADMVAEGNATVYPAAHFCNDLVIGGYTDWYMPAKYEQSIGYFNLKPAANYPNDSTSGTNPNAVPPRASNYGYYDPLVTTVTLFTEPAGTEYWDRSTYSSSTESATTTHWCTSYYGGYEFAGFKNEQFVVRAIRKVAV